MGKFLKTELQSFGVRLGGQEVRGRKGGAGPAEGIVLKMNNLIMAAPAFSGYAQHSPYELHRRQAKWVLVKGKEKFAVDLPDFSDFYSRKTVQGKLFSQIALIHGVDCLASTVKQSCSFWGTNQECMFCGIELSLKNGATVEEKDPQELAEVAKAAEQIGINHLTLTSGSTVNGVREIRHLSECTKAVKQATNLLIQVQCRPPQDLSQLETLRRAGVDTIGIHVESFDWDLLGKIAPNKARLGLDKYIKAWRKAVELFGYNQVVSYILAGLGETDRSILYGAKLLAEMGVYPFLVPFRPIPGTAMADKRPPNPDRMISLYRQVAEIIMEAGLTYRKVKAGCGRCTACSALPDYENYSVGNSKECHA